MCRRARSRQRCARARAIWLKQLPSEAAHVKHIMSDAAASDAVAAPTSAPKEKQRKKFIESVSRKDYISVMRAVNDGMPPNADWKGLLPLRTAVLVGDADMVALLRTLGADPHLEPKAMVEAKDDQPAHEITLGKSPRALASEMAKDMANPLHVDARNMLKLMDDVNEARDRVRGLHAKLEQQMNTDVRTSGYLIVLFMVLFGASFALLRYLGVNEDGGDGREL